MARIRTIKPEFFIHEGLADLSPLHRLLFIGLWTQADCAGRLQDRPRRLKVALLPYDECDIDRMLSDLDERGFVVRYEVEGERFVSIPSFAEHQRMSGSEAQAEIGLPPPPPKRKHRGSAEEAPEKHFGTLEGKGKEGKGKEGSGEENSSPPSTLELLPQEPPLPNDDPEQRVYDCWRQLWSPRAMTKVDKKRRDLITKRLRERSEEDLLDSLRGWKHDPWVERPSNAKLEQLLRDAGQVEKGLELLDKASPRALAGRQSDAPPTPCGLPGCERPGAQEAWGAVLCAEDLAVATSQREPADWVAARLHPNDKDLPHEATSL